MKKRNWKVYAYGLAPTLGGFSFGYDTGSISGILTMSAFNDFFHHPSDSLEGGITGSIQAGAIVGSLLTGWLFADRFGRRYTLMGGSSVFTLGVLLCCVSNNIYCLVAGRVINGLGLGAVAFACPLYLSESMPKEIRGRCVSLQQCSINLGILCSFLIQYGTSFMNGNVSWRLPFGLQMISTVSLSIVMFFMPESPRWLISKKRYDEALTALARVHSDGDRNDPYILAEYEEIKTTLDLEYQTKQPSYLQLLFSKEHGRRTWLGIGVQFWQQAVGINSCLYFAPFLFQQAGVGSTEASLLSNVINGVILNVTTIPNMLYLDKWGRRRLLYFGAVGMGICMLLVGVLMKTLGKPHVNPETDKTEFSFDHNPEAGKAVIAFLFIYIAVFGLTTSTQAWVVPAELFTMSSRARASSMTTATNWSVNLIFALCLPTALNRISWRVYIMFAAICFVCAVVLFLFHPETANRSLEEMDYLFKEKTIWVFKDSSLTSVHPKIDLFTEKFHEIEHEQQLKREGVIPTASAEHTEEV